MPISSPSVRPDKRRRTEHSKESQGRHSGHQYTGHKSTKDRDQGGESNKGAKFGAGITIAVSETGGTRKRAITEKGGRGSVSTPEKEMAKSSTMTGVSGDWSVFRGPEMDKIDGRELRKIQIDIRRNIPKKEVREGPVIRQLEDPLQLMIPRRSAEGKKQIFDREEIKTAAQEAADRVVEEQRVIDRKSVV